MNKECEERLEELKKPLLLLRGEAEAEFDKVDTSCTSVGVGYILYH